ATETDDRVQRGLALLALRHGDLPAAWRLFHELTRNDRFFDQPVGQVARLEAAQFLQQAMPEAPHVDGSLDPKSPEAEAQRAALAEYLRAQAGPDPGASQTSVEPEGSTVLGLELRSCRSGEAFLRWTDQDTLWVGRTSPVVVALAPGTTERLQAAADAMGAAMGKKYLTGEAGCDLEGFHWRPDGAKRSSRYLVTKGPKPVPGLRPAPLQAMAQALLLTLPSGPQLEPQLDHLRERIAGLLTDIGGALDAESGPAAR
ncbi:MAG TPA: hypothetical protein P5218_09390, partial [Planctomycetota bacterium]|nr:hypothetical protein [Planctomycetota bacterium]